MRKVARGRQDRDFEIALDLAEAAKLLDGRVRSLLTPYEQGRLAETSQGVPYIDVEMTGKKCGRRMACRHFLGPYFASWALPGCQVGGDSPGANGPPG